MQKAKRFLKAVQLVTVPLVLALVISAICCFSVLLLFNNNEYLSMLSLFLREGEADTGRLNITDIFSQTGDGEASDTVNENDVVFPRYGTRYAEIITDKKDEAIPLYFGDSAEILKLGAGQYIGSSLPGYGRPILIGGHNNSCFDFLQQLSVSDIVKIQTNYGLFEYKVVKLFIASKDDERSFDSDYGGERLVLYTCYPFSALRLTDQRYFVWADKISGPVVACD